MTYQKEPRTPGGIRLRALRESRGKTQLAVELDADLGIGYLQRLELGKVLHPERDTLERILAALDATFIERRDVLEAFGYLVTGPIPNETEVGWAIDVFQAEVKQNAIPVYLLDSAHRLLAWNSLVPRLFGKINADAYAVRLPRLIFDPSYGITESVLNADTFFSTEVRILQYERQRSKNEAWYGAFIDEMRQHKMFDEYWVKHCAGIEPQIPMRPVAQLKFDTGRGLAQFRLVAETFVQDQRFRAIYYIPADSGTLRRCLEWQG